MINKQQISIVGLGWLGLPLALQLQKKGYTINGSTTSLSQLRLLAKHSFQTCRIKVEADTITGDWEAFIDETDTLIINFPPKRIDDIETIHPSQIAQIIANTPKTTKVIFVSSTSVYQNTNELINETVTCLPEKASGHALVKAEELLQQHFGSNLTILRLSGLIGPKRHPGRFLSKKRELKNPNIPINLIHQKDAIGLIEAILEQNCFGEIINGCADVHPKRKDFYENAAIKLNLPAPIFGTSKETYYKIVDNSKSKSLLNFKYQFSNPEWIFTKEHLPIISIVGGGPGNKDLLTVKAFEAIENAEVILFDNLISEEILEINTHAEHIYVGRKFGDTEDPEERQNKINKLLKSHCEQGSRVVRIKSGDPYIYGRAAEEARFLTTHKLPFTVVPGVTAALAAANSLNIPITERGHSNAVLICTAHTANYSTAQFRGIGNMLKSGTTLALYMASKSLAKMIPKLIEVCGTEDIPINAISNVSREDEVLLSSTLGNIQDDIIKTPLQMPVVFLVGVKPIK